MNDSVKPRYILGTVSPVGVAIHPLPQPQPLLPPDIKLISSSINVSDYTHEGVHEAIGQRYWPCVDALVEQGAHSITIAGFPIASQLSRPRVLALMEETARKHGVVADSHAEATVAALVGLASGAPMSDATGMLPDGGATVGALGLPALAGTAICREPESRRNRFRSAPRSAAVW